MHIDVIVVRSHTQILRRATLKKIMRYYQTDKVRKKPTIYQQADEV